MRQLVEILEGILDSDFEIATDLVDSIDNTCKSASNCLVIKPNGNILRKINKFVKPINPPDTIVSFAHYDWINKYPGVISICKWICTQSVAWLKSEDAQMFTKELYNRCLTAVGQKEKWLIDIKPWDMEVVRDGKTVGSKPIGKYIDIRFRDGGTWTMVASLAISY